MSIKSGHSVCNKAKFRCTIKETVAIFWAITNNSRWKGWEPGSKWMLTTSHWNGLQFDKRRGFTGPHRLFPLLYGVKRMPGCSVNVKHILNGKCLGGMTRRKYKWWGKRDYCTWRDTEVDFVQDLQVRPQLLCRCWATIMDIIKGKVPASSFISCRNAFGSHVSPHVIKTANQAPESNSGFLSSGDVLCMCTE